MGSRDRRKDHEREIIELIHSRPADRPSLVHGPQGGSLYAEGAMFAQHGPVPEISITFDPATRCYGFSTRLPGMRPHWVINTFESLEDVMRWADPWRERIWEEPSDADEDRLLISRSKKQGAL